MAASAKYLSLLFLVFFISLAQTQARESKFFSKFTFQRHLAPTTTSGNTVTPVPSSNEVQFPPTYAPAYPPDAPAFAPITVAFPPDNYAGLPAPALAPEPFPSIPDKTSNEEDNAHESYNNDWYGRKQYGMSDTRFMNNGRYAYHVNEENYRGNEYTPVVKTGESDRESTEEYDAREFDSSDDGLLGENGNKKNYEGSERVGGNWAETEKQGMSDTRALENGGYFYDVNMEENFNRNGYKGVSQSHGEFGSSRGVDSRNEYNGGNFFGNNVVNEDEFQTPSAEESQYQAENKEEYLP